MGTSTITLDNSVWTSMSHPEPQVSTFSKPHKPVCLRPTSYISEAAASLLDRRLDLHIVPRTELVSLSSQVRSVTPMELHVCQLIVFLPRHSSMTGLTERISRKEGPSQRR